MLTVRDSNQDAVAALDAGADDCITKPFSMEVLLACSGHSAAVSCRRGA
jgi:DNA-binding response OmpR family regulator